MERAEGKPRSAVMQAPIGVKSTVRTLNILEYFAKCGQSARTKQIGEALEIPNSSIDEILHTMVGLGYLSFDRQRKFYAPSYKLIGVMRAIETAFFGGDRLRMLLRDLEAETGCSIQMAAQNDCWTEVVAEVGSWHNPPDAAARWPLVLFDGERFMPATNFAGALMTLHSNVEIVDLVVRSQANGIAPQGAFVVHDLIERLRRIRSRGFSICRRRDQVKVDSIACPMRIPGVDQHFAVGVLGNDLLESEMEARRLAVTMKNVIAQHSRNWQSAAA